MLPIQMFSLQTLLVHPEESVFLLLTPENAFDRMFYNVPDRSCAHRITPRVTMSLKVSVSVVVMCRSHHLQLDARVEGASAPLWCDQAK